MFKKRCVWRIAIIGFSSLALFFVGCEWNSWRPQRVSKGALKIVSSHIKRTVSHSKSQISAAKKRFPNRNFNILTVSPDDKWMACDYQEINTYNCTIDIRNAQNGKLKSKLKFDNAVTHGIESVAFSPSGNYFVINFGYDDIQAAFDLRNGQRLWIFPATQVLFSPDERSVILVHLVPRRHGEQSAYIWTRESKNGRILRQIPVSVKTISLPVWLDGSNHLAFGDHNDNLWRVRTR